MRLAWSRRRIVLTLAASTVGLHSCSRAISKDAAITLAEAYVARNGYTDVPRDQVSIALDPESFELSGSRDEQLKMRFNTLKPRAIGIKPGQKGAEDGWSVAFDFTEAYADASACRVVTMDANGQHLVMQHVDGIRSYFAGLDDSDVRAQLRR